MNLLLTIAAVANPVLTALLTVLVFLESKKSKKQIEEIGKVGTSNMFLTCSELLFCVLVVFFENKSIRFDSVSPNVKDFRGQPLDFPEMSGNMPETSAEIH